MILTLFGQTDPSYLKPDNPTEVRLCGEQPVTIQPCRRFGYFDTVVCVSVSVEPV